MELATYFTDFLRDIRPTATQRNNLIRGHRTLRERLQKDERIKPYLVSVFLQGSYRRQTALRTLGETRADVDIVVVTRFPGESTAPDDALGFFQPFLDKWYPGKWRTQGRSLGIKLSYVDLDLVVTASPRVEDLEILTDVDDDATAAEDAPRITKAELDGLKMSPLSIPDRTTARWEQTHPLAQIAVTHAKNATTNGHYINVVKALKWWRIQQDEVAKHPKSYPLEHIIWTCCPDGITSIAQGVAETLAAIVQKYEYYVLTGRVPALDNHGIYGQNVLGRITPAEFADFFELVRTAAALSRRAIQAETVAESAGLWRELFGPRFPSAPGGSGGDRGEGGFSPRSDVSSVGGGRFA